MQAVAKALKTGLVTPDANVLLNLYRFSPGARDELFGTLEKLGQRLWIPHQVGLEFYQNRLNVMAEQEAYFSKVQKEFDVAIDGLREKVREFYGIRFTLALKNIEQVDQSIHVVQRLITGYVGDAEKANDVNVKNHASDNVLARIESLLGDRVGDPMELRELEETKKEARRRIEAKIPPGYKDKDKPDPTGDYLIFKQLKAKAQERNVPVVLITDDRKEDWYRREHGLTLGARWELQEEMMREAGVPFLTMTTESFLRHASKHLDAEVSPETVDQARKFPDVLYGQDFGRDYRPLEWTALPGFTPGKPMSRAEMVLYLFILWQAIRTSGNKGEQDQAAGADLEEFAKVLNVLDTSDEPQARKQQGEPSANDSA